MKREKNVPGRKSFVLVIERGDLHSGEIYEISKGT